MVKTMDLKSAYKLWAIPPADVPKVILVLKNPESGVKIAWVLGCV